MRIAIMGAGGVGGYFGAFLGEAGNDVTFIARGAHLEAMRRDGLRLKGARGDIHLSPTQATHDPATVGPVFKGNAKHVVSFAFVPVGIRVNVDKRRD